MGMTEHQIQQRIILAMGRGLRRLWRNNVGTAWAGQSQQITAANRFTIGQTLKPGDVVVRQARILHAGLCPGSADLIGYTTIEVTPDMVGQRLAVFTAVEVKTPTGRPTPQQVAFLEHVRQAGGRAGIARSIEDAERIAEGH